VKASAAVQDEPDNSFRMDRHAQLGVELRGALRSAREIGRGVPPGLERLVRAYARACRLDGLPIEEVLIDVKALVRETVVDHADVFTPRLVGWSVAGYYDRSDETSGS
jgi:hypothetical protein